MTIPAAAFVAAAVGEVRIEGRTRHAAVTLDFDSPAELTITRISATTSRDQALVIQASGPMVVAGHTGSQLVLWSSTAPATVTVAVAAGQVKMSNAWRDGTVTQAWLGAAGMKLSENGTSLRLVCSDGHDEWSVDLEIEIEIDTEVEADTASRGD